MLPISSPPPFLCPSGNVPNAICTLPAHTLMVLPDHLDLSGGAFFQCDHGVKDLAFTKAEKANEWHLYVTCNGSKRSYKITIQ